MNISKQLACQKFIFKIHSSKLRRENWNMTLPLSEARRDDQIISIADSQILRWIDQLNGVDDSDRIARELKQRIRSLRKLQVTPAIRKQIKSIYGELDHIQFKPDYMCLIIDTKKDYYRACKGFSINGVKYKRLLGTNGGIKNSTIVFVSERLEPELRRRIENERNPNMELVTAKLEAYKALTCSASNPVSMPRGVLVVNDAETEFNSDIIYLTDEGADEPIIEYRKDEPIKLNASDGFGIMLPSLAERWSQELGLGYTVSGVNVRFAFTKGMVFTFDFLDFAANVAGGYIVKDAWGNDIDVRGVELILTTSMVKLWDSYDSCEDFMRASAANGYTFGIAKNSPEKLENERNLNYQFIQSYRLDDDDIERLISPTIEEIRDVIHGDWHKSVLFLKGAGLNASNVTHLPDDFIKAIMIDPRVADDPYVQSKILQLIRNRINEAKVGVIKVHGNYSIVSGDPYLLCQSMFGMEKTGLLRAGEIYNKYWADSGAEELACFRAPMSVHANIRAVKPSRDPNAAYWYRYLTTTTVFNSWDTASIALNGCDFDGDLVMLTDNPVLVERLERQPALMCVQRKAKKRISTEDDFIKSNIESFGNEIGQTTNWITSMYEVQAGFRPGTKEYDTLQYRIMCGQTYQQNAIDKAKGIICKPMPRDWHDRHAANSIEDENKRQFYRSILADKKPYFMRYIYSDLSRQYNTYIKSTNRKALREFQLTVDELRALPYSDLTAEQKTFLYYYERRMPVGTRPCVMNRICRRFESEFDNYISRNCSGVTFDYSFMKSDHDYTQSEYKAVQRLYEDYKKRVVNHEIVSDYNRKTDEEEYSITELNAEFRKACDEICPNSDTLCNIVLDLCYKSNATKAFAWGVCGTEIINNLLNRNNHIITYPVMDDAGTFTYGGNTFTFEEIKLEDEE